MQARLSLVQLAQTVTRPSVSVPSLEWTASDQQAQNENDSRLRVEAFPAVDQGDGVNRSALSGQEVGPNAMTNKQIACSGLKACIPAP